MKFKLAEIDKLEEKFGTFDCLTHNDRDLNVMHHESQNGGASHDFFRTFTQEVR